MEIMTENLEMMMENHTVKVSNWENVQSVQFEFTTSQRRLDEDRQYRLNNYCPAHSLPLKNTVMYISPWPVKKCIVFSFKQKITKFINMYFFQL